MKTIRVVREVVGIVLNVTNQLNDDSYHDLIVRRIIPMESPGPFDSSGPFFVRIPRLEKVPEPLADSTSQLQYEKLMFR